jgi:hypothetical protein
MTASIVQVDYLLRFELRALIDPDRVSVAPTVRERSPINGDEFIDLGRID